MSVNEGKIKREGKIETVVQGVCRPNETRKINYAYFLNGLFEFALLPEEPVWFGVTSRSWTLLLYSSAGVNVRLRLLLPLPVDMENLEPGKSLTGILGSGACFLEPVTWE